MAKPVTGQTVFGANTTGTTTQLDNNFLLAYNALNDLNTYSNYIVDSGVANAYVVTLASNLTASLAAGLSVQFKAVNANTGASTLNVNGTGVKNIINSNGNALDAGQIPAGGVINVIYDGTSYMLLGALAGLRGIKVGSFTRDISSAGNQTITGVGFPPRFITFLGTIIGTPSMSVGVVDVNLTQGCVFDDSGDMANTYANDLAHSIVVVTGAATNGLAAVVATNSDGFVVTWSKTGSPTGNATVIFGALA